MAVEVRLPTVLRTHAGGASVVSVDGATVGVPDGSEISILPAVAGG